MEVHTSSIIINNNIRRSHSKRGENRLNLSTSKLVPFTTRGQGGRKHIGNNDDSGSSVDLLLPFWNRLQKIGIAFAFSSPQLP
jgi:hypothetical protein